MTDSDSRSANEAALIRSIIGGDRDQYRELVQRYSALVYRVILRQVGNEPVAEELTQETFVKAFLNLSRFRYEARFSTWVVRIALNLTNSYLSSRRAREQHRTESLNEQEHQHEPAGEDLEQRKEQERQLSAFQEALCALRPKLREVVVLCSLEGKSYQEAAALLGVPVGTVRSRLNTARLALKEALGEVL